MRIFKVYLPATALLACLIGCGSEPLRVTAIQLGRSLNADNTVAGHTSVFGAEATVYVSIATAGVGSGTLSVKWMYGARVVGEPSKQIECRDDAVTEFHLQSAGGFPVGDYAVEVFLDGKSVGKRDFKVE